MADKEKKPIQILREKHGGMSDGLKEYLKNQTQVRKKLTGVLKAGSKTIPQLAKETGIDSQDVVWHIMAMKRYGKIVEAGKSGDYYMYQLKGEAS